MQRKVLQMLLKASLLSCLASSLALSNPTSLSAGDGELINVIHGFYGNPVYRLILNQWHSLVSISIKLAEWKDHHRQINPRISGSMGSALGVGGLRVTVTVPLLRRLNQTPSMAAISTTDTTQASDVFNWRRVFLTDIAMQLFHLLETNHSFMSGLKIQTQNCTGSEINLAHAAFLGSSVAFVASVTSTTYS